ncbi:MAG TPA: IS6 family transposase [Chloroflexota bacterium]|nr:IS6 family transposase [Chloroflexota bacterium]
MERQHCQGERFTKEGHDREGRQIYRRTADSASAFAGYRFPADMIALAVRWYLRYRLSYADLAELLAERGIHVDPSTIYDWVQHFSPLYQEAARSHRPAPRGKWAIDETYIKVAGVTQYVFRAIDEQGQVIDIFVSPTRDTDAAVAFLRRAVRETGVRPHLVTTDKAAIYPPALAAVLPEAEHVAGKIEQQAIERDHAHLKGRYRPMRGFKQTRCAQVVCAGHGFMRNLRDGFYRLGFVWYGPAKPHPPRLLTAWDELTATLCAA